jgi:hypothetical protein
MGEKIVYLSSSELTYVHRELQERRRWRGGDGGG